MSYRRKTRQQVIAEGQTAPSQGKTWPGHYGIARDPARRVANCVRWYLNAGKPCMCGQHTEAA